MFSATAATAAATPLFMLGGLNGINTIVIIIIITIIRTIITNLAVITPSPPPPLPSAAVAALVVASCYPTSVPLILWRSSCVQRACQRDVGIVLNYCQYGVLYLGSRYNTGPYINFPHFGNSILGLPHVFFAHRGSGGEDEAFS